MPVLTIEEARNYAHDWEASDEEMTLFIAAADGYLRAALGDGFPEADPRVKTLAGMLVTEFDDVRETTTSFSRSEGNSRRELVRGMLCQLRTEMIKEA